MGVTEVAQIGQDLGPWRYLRGAPVVGVTLFGPCADACAGARAERGSARRMLSLLGDTHAPTKSRQACLALSDACGSPRLRRVSGDWRGGGGEGDGFGRRGAHDDGAEFGETLAGAGDEIGAGKAVEIGEGGKQTLDAPTRR